MNIDQGRAQYAELQEYAGQRTKELTPMLQPFIDVTDHYGEMICEIILILGQIPPASKYDSLTRDLLADVFDFLNEARPLIIRGKLEIAYPLARRAYESLSLMVACHLDLRLADRWIANKQIGNSEVRRILGKHPMGEDEVRMQEAYSFFSKTTHPNRSHLAQRSLGEGNEFVLGAVGIPSLTLLADYALKTLNLWFWCGAFASHLYTDILDKADPQFFKTYHDVSEEAKRVAGWLVEQFNRVLAEEQDRMRKTQQV
jgi:hypothetical protein